MRVRVTPSARRELLELVARIRDRDRGEAIRLVTELAERLDAAEGFQREGGAGDCWSWFGPSKGSSKAVADLTLGEDQLRVLTQSLAWASKANSRLVEELGELITGEKKGRSSNAEITLFKSVGLAVQDLAAAACVLERNDLGREIPL